MTTRQGEHWGSRVFSPPDLTTPLLLYGAGRDGRSVAKHLKAQGSIVSAFIDAHAAPGEVRDGIPVFTLDEWASAGRVDGATVLVSIRNADVNIAPILDLLSASGFSRVMSMVDYVNCWPIDSTFSYYWLAPASAYTEMGQRLAMARAVLSDDLSRTWFDALMRLRLAGDYHGLPTPTPTDQYVPTGLSRWTNPMRLIDCGAYVGDTVALMIRDGYQLDAAIAFEPDPDSYAKLITRFGGLNITYLPCGVSDMARMVTFSGGLGTASRVQVGGTGLVQCAAIDHAIPAFAPTLIKMDVEGSEEAALEGAFETLRKHRPGLALSVYHEPDHLWTVPLLIDSLGLDYRMFLRGHGHNGYDTVFYCIPN